MKPHFFCQQPEWTSISPSPVSSKEWWDVKGHLKTLPGDSTNTRAFKVGERSPLRELSLGDATKYIRIDPAHTWAIDGVGKDFLASCIILLVRANHFGSGSTPHSLQNAYASFLAYCNAYKKTTSITEFGFSTFKLPQNSLPGFVNIFSPNWKEPITKSTWHFRLYSVLTLLAHQKVEWVSSWTWKRPWCCSSGCLASSRSWEDLLWVLRLLVVHIWNILSAFPIWYHVSL